MNFIIITIAEIVYIIYTFWFMKTIYYINNPFFALRCFEKTELKNNIKSFFTHPVGRGEPTNYICPFGKYMILVLSIFLIIRLYIITFTPYSKYIKNISIGVLTISFFLSFMNMNALFYLIPFFIVELVLISKY